MKESCFTRPNLLGNGSPLFCDLYHLTMAQAWFLDGKAEEIKTSEAFFRKCPFGGSYLVSAGLGEFLQWLKNWHFSPSDIDYLRQVRNTDGSLVFNEHFLTFIAKQKLNLTIRAVHEGELIFPNEPVYSVTGPTWQVDLVEAALLNIFNSQSLVATKASRMVYAASLDGYKRPLLEFGLRRGHELGGLSETRAAFIGGACGTSNTAAAQYYGIPASGTMAHSFVMSYENEIDAFKAFMSANPHNTTLLVDTYDTRLGIQHAIQAAKETGIPLMGMRIDSGDLAYWARVARELIDAEGNNPLFTHVKLVASNDLDEHLIENLLVVQKAPYDVLAAGTKLVTAYDTPALGGVFKTKQYLSSPRIKIAEGKTTIPGATDVIRIVRHGLYEGDIICRAADTDFVHKGKLAQDITSYTCQSLDGKRVTFKAGETAYTLLQTVVDEGQFVISPELNLFTLQQRTQSSLSCLDSSYKRLANSHLYGVGLEAHLFNLQKDLIQKYLRRN
ncbi:MAG: nicotinate phosphoribosyltransferase [Alphaproteobacteria bacterium]|nr:nicotinate phosphoribosyltransferase [Alphaproteobacteria bacterium]